MQPHPCVKFNNEAPTMTQPVLHPALPRVLGTPEAIAFLQQLQTKHGALLFFQSGGCCDGSAPLCYAQNDFQISDQDILLGEIKGAPFYMSPEQFEYWKHTQLIIDLVDGMGGMFSLDNGTGKRFLTRSRLFSDEEYAQLEAISAS